MRGIVCLAGLCLWAIAAAADPSLTIYNQDFAVVRDQITMELNKGETEIRRTDITAHLEPSSVILRARGDNIPFQILEQNYRSDPVSQNLLLSLNEGKTIDFEVFREQKPEIVRGKIIRSGYVPHSAAMNRYGQQYAHRQYARAQQQDEPIIEIDGRVRFGLPGQPLFPKLDDDSILKPTLSWIIGAPRKEKIDAELAYISGGMSWEADYNLVSPELSDKVDITGWVTIDNQCGKEFVDADIKLMAGDVNKLEPGFGGAPMAKASRDAMYEMSEPQVTEKSFDEYHLYTLRRPVTLHDRETKQVEFIRATGVDSKRIFVYDGAWINPQLYRHWNMESIRNQREYGAQSNPKVWVMREIMNSEQNGLGLPLPRGRVRFYRQDDVDGRSEFVGENLIDHTPKNEKLRVYTGDAFDLVGERRQTNYKIDHTGEWLDEAFEIKLRNHKDTTVTVQVVEHLYRWFTWDIKESSHKYEKKDAQTIEYTIELKPEEEAKIEYQVHYSW